MRDLIRDLDKATKRLTESVGRTVARRNARKEATSILRSIKKKMNEQFPPYGKGGVERRVPSIRGGFCPSCKSPFRSLASLAKHIKRKHSGMCPCGQLLPINLAAAVQHLRAHKSLKDEHLLTDLAASAFMPRTGRKPVGSEAGKPPVALDVTDTKKSNVATVTEGGFTRSYKVCENEIEEELSL